MDDRASDADMFTFVAVRRKAPLASSVYTIYTARRRVYVGVSDDIQQSLFRHLNTSNATIHQFSPLSFSFELAPAEERSARRQELIATLDPACAPL